jgi:hypothetical protein
MYLPSLGWDFRVRLDLTTTDESVALRHPALIVLPDRAPAWYALRTRVHRNSTAPIPITRGVRAIKPAVEAGDAMCADDGTEPSFGDRDVFSTNPVPQEEPARDSRPACASDGIRHLRCLLRRQLTGHPCGSSFHTEPQCSSHECEVAQRLRKVASEMPRFHVVFFGQESQIVAHREHALKGPPGGIAPTLQSLAICEPAGARKKSERRRAASNDGPNHLPSIRFRSQQ